MKFSKSGLALIIGGSSGMGWLLPGNYWNRQSKQRHHLLIRWQKQGYMP